MRYRQRCRQHNHCNNIIETWISCIANVLTLCHASCNVKSKIECNTITKWTIQANTEAYRISNTLLLNYANIRIIFLSFSHHFNPFELFVVCFIPGLFFSLVNVFLVFLLLAISFKVFERMCDFSQNLKLQFSSIYLLVWAYLCTHVPFTCWNFTGLF